MSASDQADFIAHLGELKVRGGAILQGFTKFDLIINGNAKAGVNSPVLDLTASVVEALASASGSIVADIPVFRLNCALDAFADAGSWALVAVASDGASEPESPGQVQRHGFFHGRLPVS